MDPDAPGSPRERLTLRDGMKPHGTAQYRPEMHGEGDLVIHLLLRCVGRQTCSRGWWEVSQGLNTQLAIIL